MTTTQIQSQTQSILTNSLSIYSVVYYSFIIVGLVLSIVSIFVRGSSGAIVTITAYTCILAGLLLILGILFDKLKGKTNTLMDTLNLIKINIGPFLLLALTIVYLLSITIYYKPRISEGSISENYYTFSNLTIILICIQFAILYTGMNKQIFKQQGVLPLSYSSLIYLVGIINIIFVISIGVMLKYYTTDG